MASTAVAISPKAEMRMTGRSASSFSDLARNSSPSMTGILRSVMTMPGNPWGPARRARTFECFHSVSGCLNAQLKCLERLCDPGKVRRIVIDEKYLVVLVHCRTSPYSAGIVSVKIEPFPTSLSTRMSPPRRWANSRLIASPRPSPMPGRVIPAVDCSRWNFSKMSPKLVRRNAASCVGNL